MITSRNILIAHENKFPTKLFPLSYKKVVLLINFLMIDMFLFSHFRKAFSGIKRWKDVDWRIKLC